MHKYPIHLFSIASDDFRPDQLDTMFEHEAIAGYDISGDTGIPGLTMDFNSGVRVQVPEGNFHVRISDYDSGAVGYDSDCSEQVIISAEKFYVCWQVEIWQDGRKKFDHVLDLTNQRVFIYMAVGVLGDTIGMLPYVKAFKEKHGGKVLLYPPKEFIPLCQQYLPEIEVISERPEECYASYCLAVFEKPPYLIPIDSRRWTTDYAARNVLGLHHNAEQIKYYPVKPRQIREPYVCIAVQSSGIMKRWLYPGGWDTVVATLKQLGYRVLCIDGSSHFEQRGYTVDIPAGAEDFTGMLPLMDRINLLAYADFFIGLPSGLSWLAHACDIPVVMIAGFSLPIAEFDTPYRIMNNLVCHGCYNDIAVNWKDDCPYHFGTDREYECSKSITPKMVLKTIMRLLEDKAGQEGTQG